MTEPVTFTVTVDAATVKVFALAVAEQLAAAQTPTATPGYLTAREAADYLRVSENHIRYLVSSNGIPFVRVGRSVRFRAADIDAWLSKPPGRPGQSRGI